MQSTHPAPIFSETKIENLPIWLHRKLEKIPSHAQPEERVPKRARVVGHLRDLFGRKLVLLRNEMFRELQARRKIYLSKKSDWSDDVAQKYYKDISVLEGRLEKVQKLVDRCINASIDEEKKMHAEEGPGRRPGVVRLEPMVGQSWRIGMIPIKFN